MNKKSAAKVVNYLLCLVDKTFYKVDKTIFILPGPHFPLLEIYQDQELGLLPYNLVKQRVKYFGSLKPTA